MHIRHRRRRWARCPHYVAEPVWSRVNPAIAVHNHGAVIPPQQLDGIFNPMKERRATHNAWGKGPTGSLGLGLYIAERIVRAHQGRIDVESSDASGHHVYRCAAPRREEAVTPSAQMRGR